MTSPALIAVMGPTASGKSDLAEALATELEADIVNADAFQVYRGMDIGTAKPSERSRYHLLDIKEPSESFGVGEFVLLAADIMQKAFDAGQNVVVCGGTGFYVRALIEEFTDLEPAPDPNLRAELEDRLANEGLPVLVAELEKRKPELAKKTDLMNPVRVRRALERCLSDAPPIKFTLPSFRKIKVALSPNAEISFSKITQRTQAMIQNGWVREVEMLLDQGYKSGDPGFRAIGYELIESFIRSGGEEQDLKNQIILETTQYAKRQRTWLRSEPNLITFTDSSEAMDAVISKAKSDEN
jgi:tRNA dimethylallyltransferase